MANTVVNVTAGPTLTPTLIPATAGDVTIALVTINVAADQKAVVLPTGLNIGDLVEVYVQPPASTQTLSVFPPTGMTIGSNGSPTVLVAALVAHNKGRLFRYVDTNAWQVTTG